MRAVSGSVNESLDLECDPSPAALLSLTCLDAANVEQMCLSNLRTEEENLDG